MLSEDERATPLDARVIPIKRKRDAASLLVHEIYSSIQGESTWAGVPCTFVRTTGCHLRCNYCDTAHAFYHGTERTLDDVLAEVARLNIPLVELTGGEPLLQKASFDLVTRLCDAGHTVLIETSGAVALAGLDPRAHAIVDVKTPGSGEASRHVEANWQLLKAGRDEVKFVLTSEADYAFAVATRAKVPPGVTVLFSAAQPLLSATWLAERIVRDRLDVRFQLQMHKVLWGDKSGV